MLLEGVDSRRLTVVAKFQDPRTKRIHKELMFCVLKETSSETLHLRMNACMCTFLLYPVTPITNTSTDMPLTTNASPG